MDIEHMGGYLGAGACLWEQLVGVAIQAIQMGASILKDLSKDGRRSVNVWKCTV